MERHNSEMPLEGAGLATWETPGWLMLWNENDAETLSDVCVLNRGKTTIGVNDLLSIWIPSIISIKEYTEKLRKKK